MEADSWKKKKEKNTEKEQKVIDEKIYYNHQQAQVLLCKGRRLKEWMGKPSNPPIDQDREAQNE